MKVHNMFLPAAMLVGGGVSTAFAIAGAANDAPAASIAYSGGFGVAMMTSAAALGVLSLPTSRATSIAGLALFGVAAAASVVAGVGLIASEQARRA